MVAQIELNNVSLTFSAHGKAFNVLQDISLSLNKGEFVVLLGPSGCGKSTILNLIAGFQPADRGRVLVDGRAIRKPGPERGMIFQQANLFPWLSVLENVTFGPRLGRYNAAAVNAKARDWLRRVGLQGFEDYAPWQLSGGMKQRVALARAWLPEPEVLLLDEPFGALDAQTRLMMQELLREAWLATQTTMLFVTHDVEEALFLADRILIMSARPGKIVEEVSVPFGRQRDIETLAEQPEYGEIKQHVLHQIRQEAKRHLA